eukprot:TRINITY_DN64090_c0_g1_i1.p1 TRINITY_DN64090_c0_g1~~TRINITY_DN64090_c0_g1_i1.p1  ORF type:complete len:512 (+),score=89.79 TRINITY_DN64090_c0_g1_i1:63-1538(+)
MGNSTATGHALTMAGVTQKPSAFYKTLELTMRQHDIQPWDPKALITERLERQTQLSKVAPFRYLNVRDGLAFYTPHVGGWVTPLTRERFVELSLEFFRSRRMHISTEDAKHFYDIFDAIDLYGDAKLSLGELVGGLSAFLAGTVSDHTEAVFQALCISQDGKLQRAQLKDFIQPFVWRMVPDYAQLLRPMFADFVTDEMLREISFHPNKNYLEIQELRKYVQFAHPSAYENAAAYTTYSGVHQPDSPVYSKTIVDRAAAIMAAALQVATMEFQQKTQLWAYGQQTWQASHPGQAQYVRDVGMYRTLQNSMSQAPAVVPSTSVWNTVSAHAATVHQAATQAFSNVWSPSSRVRIDTDPSVYSITPLQSRRSSSISVPLPPPPPPASAFQTQPPMQPQPMQPPPPQAAQQQVANQLPPPAALPSQKQQQPTLGMQAMPSPQLTSPRANLAAYPSFQAGAQPSPMLPYRTVAPLSSGLAPPAPLQLPQTRVLMR